MLTDMTQLKGAGTLQAPSSGLSATMATGSSAPSGPPVRRSEVGGASELHLACRKGLLLHGDGAVAPQHGD